MKKKITYVTCLLSVLGFFLFISVTQAVGTIGDLNDTGQTLCYDGSSMVACTAANTGDDAPYPRQDGRYGRDAQALAGKLTKIGAGDAGFDFTKISNSGTELPASATLGTKSNNWACTRDNVTGLMWDARSSYATGTWDNATGVIISTNSIGLCGFSDWRLPNPYELQGITHAGIYNSAIDPSFFTTIQNWYWTNATSVDNPTDAWIVMFDDGHSGYDNKSFHFTERLVRSDQIFNLFHENLDGTITHTPSGAIWTKCSVGQTYNFNGTCTGTISKMTWQQALVAAKNLRLGGFNDWRLPNKKELNSLINYTTSHPAIYSTYFPATLSDWYWTSTTVTFNPAYAWIVDFSNGTTNNNNKNNNYAVRLVRSGQCFDPLTGACGSTVSTNTLTISKVGTGSGSVISQPAGISCGLTCNATYSQGSQVTLTATPASGSTFAGWSGSGCSGAGTCVVTLTSNQTVIATFNTAVTPTYSLIVIKSGTGSGTVTSQPSGISCGSTCNATYSQGYTVYLTATPNSNTTFAGWSGGGCSGTGTCAVTLNSNQAVTATFNTAATPTYYSLTVNKSGNGAVTSQSSGITLTGQVMLGSSPVCARVLANGVGGYSCEGAGHFSLANVPLDANGQMTLFVWSDGMTSFKSVFTPANAYPVQNVTMSQSLCAGTGGTLNGGSAGIQTLTLSGKAYATGTSTPVCAAVLANGVQGFSCDNSGGYSLANVPVDSQGKVTLFAWADGFLPYKLIFTPASATEQHNMDLSIEAGCSGHGTAALTNLVPTRISAGHMPTEPMPLIKTAISGQKGEISCGSTCSGAYLMGTSVTLTARPDSGWAFSGWSGGGCSGNGTCTVTMDSAKSVTATFTSSGR